MNAKYVIAETLIGAADGLIGQGWTNPEAEVRIDRLREHPDREPEGYAQIRDIATAQAKNGLWTEAGLNAWLDVIETPAAELYPVIAASLLAGDGSLPEMVETRLWYGGNLERIAVAVRLLEIEIGTQARFLDLPAEVIWSASPPIDAQVAVQIGLDLLPPAVQPSDLDEPGF